MATLSRWTDFKGKVELDRLILVIVGGVEQPYKRFIEEMARDYDPPLSLIFLRTEPVLTNAFQELTRLITATSTINRIIRELLGSKGA
jgi:hypothetical protein